jgi:hypothetical protein
MQYERIHQRIHLRMGYATAASTCVVAFPVTDEYNARYAGKPQATVSAASGFDMSQMRGTT